MQMSMQKSEFLSRSHSRRSATFNFVPGALVFLAGMLMGGEVLLLAMRLHNQFWPPLVVAAFAVSCIALALVVARASHPGPLLESAGCRPPLPGSTAQILTVCAYCRKVLDEGGTWHSLETYLQRHFEGRCSHGICPECYKKSTQDI